jgi:hypothetical protein
MCMSLFITPIIYHLPPLQSSWYIKLLDAWWWIISFFNHCFPVDKYETLEYSRVKAITVSVHLWNFLCALINTNTYPMSTSKKLCRHISRLTKSLQAPRFRWKHHHHRRHTIVGNVANHWKNNAVKSWNKSRKIRTPMKWRGLESWWVVSTIR